MVFSQKGALVMGSHALMRLGADLSYAEKVANCSHHWR